MTKFYSVDEHERFETLAILADAGALSEAELSALVGHLQECARCREAYREHQVLTTEGIASLAETYGHDQSRTEWDVRVLREKLFAHIKNADTEPSLQPLNDPKIHTGRGGARPHEQRPSPRSSRFATIGAAVGIAAMLVAALGIGAYRMGGRSAASAIQAQASAEDGLRALAAQKKSAEELLAAQNTKLAELEYDGAIKEQSLKSLLTQLQTAEARLRDLSVANAGLTTANSAQQDDLHAATQQRDALSAKLRDAEQAYQNVEYELTKLHAEREKAQIRTVSLESQIDGLTASNRDLERRLNDDEEYLASDRDIREMMGARKLYIADVFDVDSGSRTRKPYGRIFLTKGKSLLFYAFDLDQRRGLKTVSTFQAWGQKEVPQGQGLQAVPLSLGILYMDSEANRRWVLRCDDPKRLEEIDAVFVTVEPHGGSQKPSTKPFLYALLRKEANHS
jgi:hypothetical protein